MPTRPIPPPSPAAEPRSPARDPADEAERRFLAEYDVRSFDRPSVAVDVVLTALGRDHTGESRLQALLLPREEHPFRARFALPGGFVRLDEGLDAEGRPLPLAFDHADLLGMAVKRLRGKLGYTPIGFQLLPECFTLRALQSVHETILGRPLNKDSFRRRMLSSGELEATGDHEDEVGHRPAELYRFARRSAL